MLDGAVGALIANEPMTAEVFAEAAALRAVVRTGVGYDSVDVEAATRAGVSVSNLPGVNAGAVAEYTMALLLAQARRLVPVATGVEAGRWPREDGHELRGKTLGLLGYGAAARAVVPLAQAFGLSVLCTTGVPASLRDDASVRFVELPELLASSDFLSLHTALTPSTRGLIDASALARMKPTAHLVNTARGALVDERRWPPRSERDGSRARRSTSPAPSRSRRTARYGTFPASRSTPTWPGRPPRRAGPPASTAPANSWPPCGDVPGHRSTPTCSRPENRREPPLEKRRVPMINTCSCRSTATARRSSPRPIC
nr:NAD(P)-dependent oxidoreductase [Actinomadura madurae]